MEQREERLIGDMFVYFPDFLFGLNDFKCGVEKAGKPKFLIGQVNETSDKFNRSGSVAKYQTFTQIL
jgi:hypothetical protein